MNFKNDIRPVFWNIFLTSTLKYEPQFIGEVELKAGDTYVWEKLDQILGLMGCNTNRFITAMDCYANQQATRRIEKDYRFA